MLEALAESKQILYAHVAEEIAPYLSRVTALTEYTRVMRGLMKPGFEFAGAHMRKLFGLSEGESGWFLDFARKQGLLITVRSRAEQSVKWLAEGLGAALKPGWIKMKTVNWFDVKFLGYNVDDIGRLILRPPPHRDAVYRALAEANVRPGSAQYNGALDRYARRLKEFNQESGDGLVQDMQRWNEQKFVRGRWEWSGNSIDPLLQADEFSRVPFKLFPSGRKGEYIVRVNIDGKWRSVTGDVDMLSITHADGRPLSELEHIKILKLIREGPVGASHPESATWTKINGDFNFDAKFEFLGDKVCCSLQFGPDGKARAVMFVRDKSQLVNARKYFLWYEGGFQHP